MSKKPYRPERPHECWSALWAIMLCIVGGAMSFALHDHYSMTMTVHAKWYVTAGFAFLLVACVAYYFYAWTVHLAEENARLAENNDRLRESNANMIDTNGALVKTNSRLAEMLEARAEALARFRENLHVPLDRRPTKESKN